MSYCCLASVVLDNMEYKYMRKIKKYMGEKKAYNLQTKSFVLEKSFSNYLDLELATNVVLPPIKTPCFTKWETCRQMKCIAQGLHLWGAQVGSKSRSLSPVIPLDLWLYSPKMAKLRAHLYHPKCYGEDGRQRALYPLGT